MALLTNIAGKAMREGLAEPGIQLGRINYQDNENWRSELHVHLYGRSLTPPTTHTANLLKAARTKAEKITQESLTSRDCEIIRSIALAYAEDDGYAQLNL